MERKRRPGADDMTFRSIIEKQFSKPRGLIGALTGTIMAHRPSNRQRNAWTIEQLDIQPDDRVLEIGCGPGVAIAEIAVRLETGLVVGIDHSHVMIDQATLRNRSAIRAGRVELRCRGIDDLPVVLGGYTKVLAVNVLQFLPDLGMACNAIAKVMAPGALLAVTYQPRLKNPSLNAAAVFGDRLAIALVHAGFDDIRMEEMPQVSGPVICVLGTRSGNKDKKSNGAAVSN
jgi:SAM-dependent methyltransferase